MYRRSAAYCFREISISRGLTPWAIIYRHSVPVCINIRACLCLYPRDFLNRVESAHLGTDRTSGTSFGINQGYSKFTAFDRYPFNCRAADSETDTAALTLILNHMIWSLRSISVHNQAGSPSYNNRWLVP